MARAGCAGRTLVEGAVTIHHRTAHRDDQYGGFWVAKISRDSTVNDCAKVR
jgi:hypothetical protein